MDNLNTSLTISHSNRDLIGSFKITGSKSESNRILILDALFPDKLTINNLSASDDTQVLEKAFSFDSNLVDIGHAGTAMRFLTAYFAQLADMEVVLTGSARMKQRPIGVLVQALRQLGAKIEYLENEGYPPLKISGRKLIGGRLEIQADVSSQFLTALLLIAPKLTNGITLVAQGKLTSWPYLKMTLDLLGRIGVESTIEGNEITVQPKVNIEPQTIDVESDWSSASYFYSLVALSDSADIILENYRAKSLQGDRALVEIYSDYFGVNTTFESTNRLHLNKTQIIENKFIKLNLIETPDIAQTILATCAGMKRRCVLTGLHTLKIKETDRLEAMRTELEKIGVESSVGDDYFEITGFKEVHVTPVFDTYHDHRMAMALAPLALLGKIKINDPSVVSKSFPSYWADLEQLGFHFE